MKDGLIHVTHVSGFGVNCDANDNVIGLELSDNNLDGNT